MTISESVKKLCKVCDNSNFCKFMNQATKADWDFPNLIFEVTCKYYREPCCCRDTEPNISVRK